MAFINRCTLAWYSYILLITSVIYTSLTMMVSHNCTPAWDYNMKPKNPGTHTNERDNSESYSSLGFAYLGSKVDSTKKSYSSLECLHSTNNVDNIPTTTASQNRTLAWESHRQTTPSTMDARSEYDSCVRIVLWPSHPTFPSLGQRGGVLSPQRFEWQLLLRRREVTTPRSFNTNIEKKVDYDSLVEWHTFSRNSTDS